MQLLMKLIHSGTPQTESGHRSIKKKINHLLYFISIPHPDLKDSSVSPVHSLKKPSKEPANKWLPSIKS